MKKRVLVVEDEKDIRDILNYILTTSGYEVNTANNAFNFFKEIELSKPDLILLDVMLPDGNGLELCKAVKNSPQTAHIPVIIISAQISVSEVFEESDADDFIPKPFDIENVVWRVEKHLTHQTDSAGS